MAPIVPIDGLGFAKVRHPVAVPVLSLITLGIYGLYWWYQINREIADLGRARNVTGLGESPALSLLAAFPGVLLLLIPTAFTIYGTTERAQRAQEVVLGRVTLNGWVVLVLVVAVFFTLIGPLVAQGYLQLELNKVWDRLAPERAGAAGEPPLPPAP